METQSEMIVTIVHGDSLESNLVYALDKGYYYIAQVDYKWLFDRLHIEFGRNVNDIHNKYTIVLRANTGRPLLITNHDGKYWITEKP